MVKLAQQNSVIIQTINGNNKRFKSKVNNLQIKSLFYLEYSKEKYTYKRLNIPQKFFPIKNGTLDLNNQR